MPKARSRKPEVRGQKTDSQPKTLPSLRHFTIHYSPFTISTSVYAGQDVGGSRYYCRAHWYCHASADQGAQYRHPGPHGHGSAEHQPGPGGISRDFRDYPRIDYSNTNLTPDRIGAVTLCWALVAPGPDVGSGSDGALGPGFRLRGTQGQVYGPYIQPGKFNISGTNNWNSTINDVNGSPYLYFPGFSAANVHVAGGYVGNYTTTLRLPNPCIMPPTI